MKLPDILNLDAILKDAWPPESRIKFVRATGLEPLVEKLAAALAHLVDRVMAREIVRTNDLGAKGEFAIGNTIGTYRITRHRIAHTKPWATYIVYGVKNEARS